MSISVQNTSSALLALQTLNRLNDPSSAGDAAGASALADQPDPEATVVSSGVQGLNADSLSGVSASLDRATSIADAALSAGQTVSDLLNQMKALASAAQDGSSGQPGTDMNAKFADLTKQVSEAVSSAAFDGVNLLDGSGGATVQAGGGPGGPVTLTGADMTPGGSTVTIDASADLSTPASAGAALTEIEASIANVSQTLGQIGDQAQQIQSHSSFVSRLNDVLASAGGQAGGQSLSADGARLMALQVQQQLTLQGGAIANAVPGALLSLFK